MILHYPIRKALLCLAILILIPAGAMAQSPADLTLAQSGSMPAWTVPVLRLVSATHVEPTTGIVLSDSGMVLVPAEFAGPGDEIIVLDGGTDIIRNGRPAKIIKRFTAEGLQVLSVPTLRRQGASLASNPLTDGAEIRLSAYPPAELIAEGKPPLDIQTTVSIPVENGKPAVAGDNPLPNVSGALVDACGNLVGYSSASGVQSMSTTDFPRYQWKDTLIRLAEELQVTVRQAACQPQKTVAPAETPAPEPQITPEPEPEEIKPEPMDDPEPELAPEQDEPVEEEALDADVPAEEENLLEELESLPPVEEEALEETAKDSVEVDLPDPDSRSHWFWLLGAVLLLGGGYLVHRYRTRGEGPLEDNQATRPQPIPVHDEADDDEPLNAGLDSELLIFGEMADGTSIEVKCPVSSRAINLLIGRGQADIAIESPAISRRHALLNGTSEMLTLSDLGSSNGTSVNGVPCLEGETMYVSPGDSIITGNARFHYRIVAAGQGQETK